MSGKQCISGWKRHEKKVFLLACVLLTLVCAAALADVKINSTNFPDSSFRQYVKSELAGGKSVMTDAEAAAVTEIRCYERGIDVATLMKSMGHTDSKITLEY